MLYHQEKANKEKVNLFKQISNEEAFEIIDLSLVEQDCIKTALKSVINTYIYINKRMEIFNIYFMSHFW